MTPSGTPRIPEFLALGASVAGVFALSIGPFVALGQLPQLGARLFPFTRGLNHAYWAPNAWALFTAADRVLLKVSQILNFSLAVNDAGVRSSSRGLVGDTVFAVLPTVQPFHTFAITIGIQTVGHVDGTVSFRSDIISGIPSAVVARTYLFIVPACAHSLRLDLVHVWLACARESNSHGSRTSHVSKARIEERRLIT